MGKYEKLAKDIIANVGGKENVISLTHCVTRLRFQLKDESIANTEVLKNMDGVVTVMQTAGQYQVVIGNHVPDVFRDVCEVAGISGDSANAPKVKRKFSEAALDLISGIFMPSIGILCASGILKGVNTLLDLAGIVAATSGLGVLLAAAADAMFLFFPIILGYNAFKKLGGNPYLGMTLGAALCYPAIQGIDIEVFGFVVNATYTSTMLPMVVLSFLAVYMEKFLNKVVPDVVKTFVVPAVVLAICLPVGFCIIGPAANLLGDWINQCIQGVYGLSPIIAGALLGFLWQILVMVGCHMLVILPIMMGLMAGVSQPLMAVVGVCSFVQTGAVFAIWMKTKNKKLKQIALPAWISGIFGVTEPAIYGVTLPNGKQFLLTCFGSAIAGALSVILGVSAYTMAGMGVFQIPGQINPANAGGSLTMSLILTVVATVIGFVVAFMTYKDKAEAAKPEVKKVSAEKEVISSPVKGNVVPLEKVEDAAFSAGALGKGIAVDPTEGKVVAPCDGTVMTLFPTKHAIGIVSDNGCEVLIHIGMNTVKLEGKGFEAHIKQGDKVKKGDVLVTFDIESLKKEGYSLVTPIIVTNTADYLDVVEVANGSVKLGDDLLTLLN
ncbi:beta-glucoside-specific PTS transporter subunit IIABC [Dielma fastidiosa]|uniref:beta-glucoside-specific PTS transporter subunit IIABC n=1 Tax=Dielma fastidiosa TaxID=1034346 RepID=UPI00356258C6